MRDRISRLFSVGTKQVWIVDVQRSTVAIYRSESDITTFSGSDYFGGARPTKFLYFAGMIFRQKGEAFMPGFRMVSTIADMSLLVLLARVRRNMSTQSNGHREWKCKEPTDGS